jgi:tetratricopeptide (TPR) repeat protein
MEYIDTSDILEMAREAFVKGQYQKAEPLLSQLLLLDNKNPEVFQMLATIYYDRGQFKKAIKTFKRALEIDPTYTDASVGLSIILNDLGRYEEGREIFEAAQRELALSKNHTDPYINERLASKHVETADLYFQYKRYDEAIEQFYKALNLSSRKTELWMKIADSYIKSQDAKKALKILRDLTIEYPAFLPAQIKLGTVLYHSNRVVEAIEEWEKVLIRDPGNKEVAEYVRIAQHAGQTEIDL